MKDLAIYGAGGFGREVACLIAQINEVQPTWNLIGFFDDGKELGFETEYGKVIGGINELNVYSTPISIVIAIGNPKIVYNLTNKITSLSIQYPNIISPSAIFYDKNNFLIGKGNIINAGCLMSCNVNIGDFNIFNDYVTVGHDTIIENCNSIMPAVKISGDVKIGNCNYLGTSSIILQRLKIGNNTVIGANSLIIRNTKDNQTYIGNPAVKVKY